LKIAKPNFRVNNGERQDVIDERLSLSRSGRYAKNLQDENDEDRTEQTAQSESLT
jgi:hypothetical protein